MTLPPDAELIALARAHYETHLRQPDDWPIEPARCWVDHPGRGRRRGGCGGKALREFTFVRLHDAGSRQPIAVLHVSCRTGALVWSVAQPKRGVAA